MKYLGIILLSGVLACKALPAQKKGASACIGKVYAFSVQHFMGTIPVDEKGNPLRSAAFVTYTFYIESRNAIPPTLKSLTAGPDTLAVGSLEEIQGQSITVGRQKGMAKDFVVRKTGGTRLWKLESGPLEGSVESNKHTSFTLSGTCGNKSFSVLVSGVVTLENPPAP